MDLLNALSRIVMVVAMAAAFMHYSDGNVDAAQFNMLFAVLCAVSKDA